MGDTFKTEVTEDDEAFMSFTVPAGDSPRVTVKISGYENQMDALRALVLLAEPGRIMGIAAEIDRATAERFGG